MRTRFCDEIHVLQEPRTIRHVLWIRTPVPTDNPDSHGSRGVHIVLRRCVRIYVHLRAVQDARLTNVEIFIYLCSRIFKEK